MVCRVLRGRDPNPGRVGLLWYIDDLLSSSFSNSGVLTPVDLPSRVGSAVITVDQAMEVDKAESIPVKQVVCVFVVDDYEELI